MRWHALAWLGLAILGGCGGGAFTSGPVGPEGGQPGDDQGGDSGSDHDAGAGGDAAELEAAADVEAGPPGADVGAGEAGGDAAALPNLCCRGSAGAHPGASVTCSENAFACGGVWDAGPLASCTTAAGCAVGDACTFCPPTGACGPGDETTGTVIACE